MTDKPKKELALLKSQTLTRWGKKVGTFLESPIVRKVSNATGDVLGVAWDILWGHPANATLQKRQLIRDERYGVDSWDVRNGQVTTAWTSTGILACSIALGFAVPPVGVPLFYVAASSWGLSMIKTVWGALSNDDSHDRMIERLDARGEKLRDARKEKQEGKERQRLKESRIALRQKISGL